MSSSRRTFIRRSAGALALAGLGGRPRIAGASPAPPGAPGETSAGDRPPRSLNLLILGGTSFLGPHQIRYALERGHQVATFNRGSTEPRMYPALFDQVEQITGDRNVGLDELRGRRWDAVIDNSGQQVAWAREAAEFLVDSVEHYLYVSSTGVYLPYTSAEIAEDVQPLLADDPPRESPSYGVMKALSEREVQRVFGDRAVIVRPQYIVGPGDTTDRFPYWPVRVARGGNVLVPGMPDDPVQLIDVRDLTEWMIRLLEEGRTGVFNAAGPASRLTMAEFVYGLRAATTGEISWTWVDDYDFLESQNLRFAIPWMIPRGDYLGMAGIVIDRALDAGLTHRPLATTAADTLEWWASDAVPEERRRSPRFVLTAEREAEILAAWRARRAGGAD